ncbi:MAG: hypothetical protein NT096_00220 [Proteobacteria bacterium]|nr:hypothetical protein [Pseudomonadota bacterium]
MFKQGDILYGMFFSKGTLLRITYIGYSVVEKADILKGNILAHNMEGHVILSATVRDYKRRDFKKVSPNDLPLYLNWKVINPEFTKLLKEHTCLKQEPSN